MLFLPKIKQLIIQRFGRKSGGLVIWLRVILVFAGIMAFSFLSTEDFEGTWISEEGKQFYLNSGNVVITEKDGTKITGTYYYEYNNVHYTIHVTTEEQEEIQLLYSPEEKNHKLCIKDEKKCIEYFDKKKMRKNKQLIFFCGKIEMKHRRIL